MGESIERVHVVVPARDEQKLVAGCVDSIHEAARHVDVPVQVLVVVNGTTDDTARIALAHGADVEVVRRPNVGAARRHGCARVLERVWDARRAWLVCTDADTQVPASWLEHHLALADAGADAVLGTICLPTGCADRHRAWRGAYADRVTVQGHHDHVHGANLGVRGSAYLAAGGFRNLECHEDVDLVERLEALRLRIARTADHPVVTSARTTGRVVGGVASDLHHAGESA